MSDSFILEKAQQWLRDPCEVRRLRTHFIRAGSRADIWSAAAMGLTDASVQSIFASMNSGKVIVGSDSALTYLVGLPVYVPYASHRIEHSAQGGAYFDQLLALTDEKSLCKTVSTGAIAAMTLIAGASLWHASKGVSEQSRRIASGLAAIARPAPKKGLEVPRLFSAYRTVAPGLKAQDMPAMIIRDFCASTFAWQCIRSPDARIHDLCGSLLVLTTAVDYVGAADDPGAKRAAYRLAASDGFTHLGGDSVRQALQDMVTACAFMKTKDVLVAASRHWGELGGFVEAAGGGITPDEFILARWWDAAMSPYHRMVMNSDGYDYLMNEAGAFDSFARCATVQRAIDNLIRYSEVVDFVADYSNEEFFNEAFVALSMGGVKALRGYGTSLSCVTDELLRCDCGEPGHDEAAEMSMGGCLWYLLLPRYQAWRQLRAFSAGEEGLASAFTLPPAGRRLQFATQILLPGKLLHGVSWQPLWRVMPSTERPILIAELTRRIVRRCLLIDVWRRECHDSLTAIAQPLLQQCDTLEDSADLRALFSHWHALFDACLQLSGTRVDSHQSLIDPFKSVLARLWGCIVACDELAGVDTEQLYVDCDAAVRRSYTLPVEVGLIVRRAFFGIATSAVELAGFNPYARLTDGIASQCEASGDE
ncbi:hypothetical protein [Pseudomonas azotoformans]|nr:hypothetical protein [Pseudomonas azotoformans]